MQLSDDAKIVLTIDPTTRSTKSKHIAALTTTSFPRTWDVNSDGSFSLVEEAPQIQRSIGHSRGALN